MKPSKSSSLFKPFRNLNTLIKRKEIRLKPEPEPDHTEANSPPLNHHQERALFHHAMSDVKKISRTNCSAVLRSKQKPQTPVPDAAYESVRRLKNLVKHGTGFVVSLTPEYIEGVDKTVNPAIAKRLHRGDFSIQAHVDLHGLGVQAARETFDRFMRENIAAGKNAALVIHGRGLSSPAEPVLKSKVYQWLTSSPWHKWVVAFTSARLCDGGTGATYVLFRQRPLAKRFRKKKKKT